jgi:hypothetical protein
MTEIRTVTLRAIYDALAMRGLEDGGGGFIRTSAPDHYMDAQRLRLARAAIKHLPDGAGFHDADRIATMIEPVIRAMLASNVG